VREEGHAAQNDPCSEQAADRREQRQLDERGPHERQLDEIERRRKPAHCEKA
jgi:hypothetical protein